MERGTGEGEAPLVTSPPLGFLSHHKLNAADTLEYRSKPQSSLSSIFPLPPSPLLLFLLHLSLFPFFLFPCLCPPLPPAHFPFFPSLPYPFPVLTRFSPKLCYSSPTWPLLGYRDSGCLHFTYCSTLAPSRPSATIQRFPFLTYKPTLYYSSILVTACGW